MLIDIGSLQIADDLSVIAIQGDHISTHNCPPGTVKAANRLGKLFGPFEIPTIYRTLGISAL